jgi:enolase
MYLQQIKEKLFESEILSPFDICEILDELEHGVWQSEEDVMDFIKLKISLIIDDELKLERELLRYGIKHREDFPED